jgi:hypothetical protein
MNTELASLPGTVESELTDEMLAQLPETAPLAPWQLAASVLSWSARPDSDAVEAVRAVLPSALRDATPLLTVGMLISYAETPVGRYDEIIGAVLLRQGRVLFTHIPFIAVSSAASVVGGRANWSLPKTLASFDGHPASGRTMTARGNGWEVAASARTRGPALPFVLPPLVRLVQVDPQGRRWSAPVRASGWFHAARVTVKVTSTGDLGSWLPRGPQVGLMTPKATSTLPAPR